MMENAEITGVVENSENTELPEENGQALTEENETGGIPGEIMARAEKLSDQADMLLRLTGTDMMARFGADGEIRGKVLSGEWDFIDAYAAMGRRQPPPAPVRSGGSGIGGLNIGSMSESQFDRLDEMLAEGGSLRM